MNHKNITIADVADALGVSKTTVSRAISGKGRISENTRKRVLDYIEEHDYIPNVIAKGLAQSKTYNLCVVMPRENMFVDLPFFHKVTAGIQETAEQNGYDILLCLCGENEVTGLERIVRNRKVDGVVLLRTLVKDLQIEFLQKRKIPFVAVGSTWYSGVVQVDNDHESACREMTSLLLGHGMKRIALLGGNESYVVMKNRYQGFVEAYVRSQMQIDESLIFMDLMDYDMTGYAVDEALERGADCILCMDDVICLHVIRLLRAKHVRIPGDVKVASFYNSSILENNQPAISSISFDARELGKEACKNLLALTQGERVSRKTLLSYEVRLRDSTGQL